MLMIKLKFLELEELLTHAANKNDGGNPKNVSTIIPLNRFSFFEELEDKMLVPMQLEFNIQLQNDDELISKLLVLIVIEHLE